MQCDTIQSDAMRCNTVRHNAIQCNAMEFHAMQCRCRAVFLPCNCHASSSRQAPRLTDLAHNEVALEGRCLPCSTVGRHGYTCRQGHCHTGLQGYCHTTPNQGYPMVAWACHGTCDPSRCALAGDPSRCRWRSGHTTTTHQGRPKQHFFRNGGARYRDSRRALA